MCWPVRTYSLLASANQWRAIHRCIFLLTWFNKPHFRPVRVQICKWGFQCWPVHCTILTSVCSAVLTSAFPSSDQRISQCCPVLISADQCGCKYANEVSSADQYALQCCPLRALQCWPVRSQCCQVHFPVLSNADQCWQAVRVQICKWGFHCWSVRSVVLPSACSAVLPRAFTMLPSAFPSAA